MLKEFGVEVIVHNQVGLYLTVKWSYKARAKCSSQSHRSFLQPKESSVGKTEHSCRVADQLMQPDRHGQDKDKEVLQRSWTDTGESKEVLHVSN